MSEPMTNERLAVIRSIDHLVGFEKELLEEVDRLRAELGLATACAEKFEDAIGYIDEYFIEKWDYRAPLEAWRASRPVGER